MPPMMITTASRNHPFHIIFSLSSSTKGKTPPGEQPFPALPPPKAAMLPAQPVLSKQLPKKTFPQAATHLSATATSPHHPTSLPSLRPYREKQSPTEGHPQIAPAHPYTEVARITWQRNKQVQMCMQSGGSCSSHFPSLG